MFGYFLLRKIAILNNKNTNLGKSQNMHFSMLLVKVLLLGKIERKTVFGEYLETNVAFLDQKHIDLGKYAFFHKGLLHGFDENFYLFLTISF